MIAVVAAGQTSVLAQRAATPPRAVRVVDLAPGSFLGVNVSEIDSERAKALKLKEERGVEITKVEEESPADKAGLKHGDVVLEYNGNRVEGTEQFIRMVRETPVGRQAKLLISREGATQALTATIGSRRRGIMEPGVVAIPRVEIPEIRIPDVPRAFMSWRSSTLGIEAESVESQLAEYFGVKQGVLVRSVQKDSPAQKAGLRAGDVIVRVNSELVATPREISSVIRSMEAKRSFPVTITRERKEATVTVTLEDDRSERKPAPVRSRMVQQFRL
jgi:serine protease Do